MESTDRRATIRAWKPAIRGVREVLHARFRDHAYPPHTHDTWTLFIVDDGAIRYALDRHARGADPTRASVLPPYVAHDGRQATPNGYRKRVLYLEAGLLPERLIGAAVDRPILADRSLRRQISSLHDLLGCVDDALEAETQLEFVAERIRVALGEPPPDPLRIEAEDLLAEQLRALFDSHPFEPITMGMAAKQVGARTTRLTRAFTKAFGIPPHRYVIGRRLDAARDRILRGQPLADVAAEVGFVDQAHLTRRFRQFLGTTPGRFARP